MYALLGVLVLSFLAGLLIRSVGWAVLATGVIWVFLFVGSQVYATILKGGLAALSLPRELEGLIVLVVWPFTLVLALAFMGFGRLVQRGAARRPMETSDGSGEGDA